MGGWAEDVVGEKVEARFPRQAGVEKGCMGTQGMGYHRFVVEKQPR